MSRASRFLLVLAAILHLFTLVSWRTSTLNPLFFDAVVTHGRRGWDFYALYQAGHNVLTGHSVYESDGAKIEMVIPDGTYTPFRYLPLSAYTLGVLLNAISPLWAYRLWVAAIEALLLGCVALTWRVVQDPDRRARATAMWLCFTPFYLELYMGQFSFVQGALLFVMLVTAGRAVSTKNRDPIWSAWGWPRRQEHAPRNDKFMPVPKAMVSPGVPFDLAWVGSVLWKQNTALLAPLMVRLKRWRALVWLALALLITAVPYFALVPGSLRAFTGNFTSEPPWFQFGNLGFRQFIFDLMWSVGDVLGVEIPAAFYSGAQMAVALLFAGLALALTLLDRRPDPVLHIGLWMSAFFLVYHHVWEHHYVMLLPVLVVLYVQNRFRWVWVIYVLIALPTPFFPIDPHGQVAVLDAMRWTPIRPLWQDLVYHASKALPALALYIALVWQIVRPLIRDWRRPLTRAAQA